MKGGVCEGLSKVGEVEIQRTDREVSCDWVGDTFSTALRGRNKQGCRSEESGGACRKRRTYLPRFPVFWVVCLLPVWRGDGCGFAEGPEGLAWPL